MSRIVLSLFSAGTAAALVVGCSSDSGTSSEPLPEAAELLTESQQTTTNLESAHLEISVDGTIKGLPVKTLSADLTNVPTNAVKGNATIVMMGNNLDVELVVIDGELFATLTPGQWEPFGPAAIIYDPSVILNPELGLANLLGDFSDATSDGAETINGTETIKVSGTVSGEAVTKLIPKIEPSEAVPATAWIERDGDHNLVRASLEPTDDSSIEITLSNWNDPVTVTKPEI